MPASILMKSWHESPPTWTTNYIPENDAMFEMRCIFQGPSFLVSMLNFQGFVLFWRIWTLIILFEKKFHTKTAGEPFYVSAFCSGKSFCIYFLVPSLRLGRCSFPFGITSGNCQHFSCSFQGIVAPKIPGFIDFSRDGIQLLLRWDSNSLKSRYHHEIIEISCHGRVFVLFSNLSIFLFIMQFLPEKNTTLPWWNLNLTNSCDFCVFWKTEVFPRVTLTPTKAVLYWFVVKLQWRSTVAWWEIPSPFLIFLFSLKHGEFEAGYEFFCFLNRKDQCFWVWFSNIYIYIPSNFIRNMHSIIEFISVYHRIHVWYVYLYLVDLLW